jgi:hypothetical protein
MVEACEHRDLPSVREVEERIGETTQGRLPHFAVNAGVGFRKSKDTGCGCIYGTHELGTQTDGLAVVPPPRLEDIEASLGT